MESGGNLKNAMYYKNCIHEPVFTSEPDETEVLDLMPPMELHLYTGPFMKIWNEFGAVWGLEKTKAFQDRLYISSPGHHGGDLEGKL